jgi:hypothetical protein
MRRIILGPEIQWDAVVVAQPCPSTVVAPGLVGPHLLILYQDCMSTADAANAIRLRMRPCTHLCGCMHTMQLCNGVGCIGSPHECHKAAIAIAASFFLCTRPHNLDARHWSVSNKVLIQERFIDGRMQISDVQIGCVGVSVIERALGCAK